jgi:uncharacterized membrane protein (DUF4010 family)
MLAIGTLIAWAVMFFRVMVISFAVYPALLRELAVAMTAMGLACLAGAGVLLWRRRADAAGSKLGEIAVSTPFTLTQAAKFGLLYAVILLVVKIVSDFELEGGLYVVAALAGLTDVDAISLSMAQYARGGATLVAAVAIVIATLANTAVKAGMAASIGSPAYRRLILAATALIAIAGAAAIAYELTLSPPPQA